MTDNNIFNPREVSLGFGEEDDIFEFNLDSDFEEEEEYLIDEEEENTTLFGDVVFSDVEEVHGDTTVSSGDSFVTSDNFSIEGNLTATEFDDYSMLEEGNLEYPYFVFDAQGSLNTVKNLCSGILRSGDVRLYYRSSNDETNYIPILKMASTPLNVRNLQRIAKKSTLFYRHTEDSKERLAVPEQFVRYIDIGLEPDEEYWNNLIEEEKSPKQLTKQDFVLEDLYG